MKFETAQYSIDSQSERGNDDYERGYADGWRAACEQNERYENEKPARWYFIERVGNLMTRICSNCGHFDARHFENGKSIKCVKCNKKMLLDD